jgi:hypothetical protein
MRWKLARTSRGSASSDDCTSWSKNSTDHDITHYTFFAILRKSNLPPPNWLGEPPFFRDYKPDELEKLDVLFLGFLNFALIVEALR